MEDTGEKKQQRFRLSSEVLEYVSDYAVINDLAYNSRSEALERIIREHKENDKNNFRLDYIVKSVTDEVTKSVQTALNKSISQEVNKVRLGTNNVDRNTQVLIELVQGFMQNNNIEHIITTKENKPAFIDEAEELIQERISKQKQRKDTK